MTTQYREREIARFAVIEVTGGTLGSVYFEVQSVTEKSDDDGETWTQRGGANKENVPATAQEVAAYVGEQNATLAAAVIAVNDLNTSLQAEKASLTQRLAAAIAALQKVAQADADWDGSPRADVAAVLQAELG